MKIKHLRIPAFLVAVILVMSFFLHGNAGYDSKTDRPMLAQAVTYVGTCGEGCKWTMDIQTKTLLVEGKGNTCDFDSKDGAPWYKYRDSIEKIVIEDGIESIGKYFFSCLNKVKTVSIASSVITIGDRAFYGCEGLKKVSISSDSRIEIIGESAFSYCRRLESFPVLSHLDTVSENAFFYCYSLREMQLGYSVRTIGKSAFNCCRLDTLRIVDPECEIFDCYETIYKNTCIECFDNSNAKAYAEKYSRRCKILKEYKNISDMSCVLSFESSEYDSNAKTPTVSINGLKEDRDFIVTYTDNIEPGIAKVNIRASGSLIGEKTLTFKIKPKKVGGLKLDERKQDSITVSWDEVHGARKYEVFMLSSGEWKKTATTNDTSYTVSGLSGGTKVSLKVRAVCGRGEERCAGKFSRVFSEFAKPGKANITKIALVRGGGKLRVSVGKVSGADGYEILMSTSENGEYETAATIGDSKKLYAVIGGLSNRNTYYFKVRSFVRNGDTVIYGETSKAYSSNVL